MNKIPDADTCNDNTEESQNPISKRFPCKVVVAGACHLCAGKLMLALERLEREGLLTADMQILAGSKASLEKCSGGLSIAVGACAAKNLISDISICACAPSEGQIYQTLLRYLSQERT